MEMLVFGGTRSSGIAWSVAKALKSEVGKSEVKTFPDGEKYVKLLSKAEGRECAVVQSVRSNDDFMELLLMLDALRDMGAVQVHAIMPYMAYMRQDKRFTEGEALSAKTLLKVLDEFADSLTMINCHFLSEGGESFYKHVRFMNLDAVPLLVKYFRSKVKNPIVVAPDKGSMGYAKAAAEILDCDFNHLSKKRISGSEVVIKSKDLDVKGKDVIILDDIISTGGTIVESVKVIRGWKPASINVGCVHGLFLKGIESFTGVVDRLVSTDTLDNPVAKVNVADLIAEDLKR
ncbi:MAG: ribose-phosphate diphosphokinase [Candidatus Altiarchaeales archaeon]|nr:ribose-phosphate diphosphokinase [Candidatus Altiarchaeales archaeon]MBD3416178.1 ribose-phosphate diphosphokinase [Candidatus Altiarchaeales archaeon]